jgi:hypothetical protein
MKWMLIIVVFGAAPIKTELRFDTFDQCLKLEQQMRESAGQAFMDWYTLAILEREVPDDERQFEMKRYGMRNQATCIPHAP